MTQQSKIIAVAGATGAQGGGLVRAILAHGKGEFVPRALTRDPDSAKARELRALGAEVVHADLDDPTTLVDAYQGAWGAYCVTNFWEHLDPERELRQARAMAEAARTAGIQHAIWSTLEDVRRRVPLSDHHMPTLNGKYKVPHFDAKGEADEHFRDSGVPTTFLYASFYWDNLVAFGMGPKPAGDGTYVLSIPMADKKLAGIAAADIGKCAWGIFKAGRKYIGQRVGIAGEHLTGAEMTRILSEVLGKTIVYRPMDFEAYRGLGFPGAQDLGNMFQFYVEFGDQLNALRDVRRSRELNPELQDFRGWAEANKARIPLGETQAA